jgi:hypothetical protein
MNDFGVASSVWDLFEILLALVLYAAGACALVLIGFALVEIGFALVGRWRK